MIWTIVVLSFIVVILAAILARPNYELEGLRQQVIKSGSNLMTIYRLRQELEFQVNIKNSYRATLEEVANCNDNDPQYKLWAKTVSTVVLGYNEGREKGYARNH